MRVLIFLGALFSLGAPLFAQNTPPRPAPSGVLIDFQETDLKVVITALAQAAGANVIFGDLPARRITLRMQEQMPVAALRSLLRSVAESNGLRVTDENGLMRIEQVDGAGAVAGPAREQQGQTAEARLYVYRLRHAQASRMAATLQAVFGGGGQGRGFDRGPRPLSEQLREQRVPPLADTTRPPTDTTAGGLPGELGGDVQIVPDEASNALLVRAQPTDWTIIEQAIQAMDLRPLQVLIEVLIAEVRETDGLEVGVSGKIDHRANGDRPRQTGELKSSVANDFVLKILGGGKVDIDVALAGLATRGNVRIISRPIVLAQNNEEAKILVGSQRPFVQVSRSLPTDAAVRDQIVQYRDVGTSLTITPTINPDDYVNLQLVQEVSTATDELQFGAPVISTREASTRLFVRNGQTAVVGGLVDRQRDVTRSGIPFLSSIPGIGALFGSTKRTTTTSELFLFLTPHLVRTDEEMDELRRRIETSGKDGEIGKTPKSMITPPKPPE